MTQHHNVATQSIRVAHRRATHGRAINKQGGFSFIEILIVMGIIGVLVGGIVVAIGIWTRKGPVFATRGTLSNVQAAIQDWEHKFEMYPPSDVTRIASVAGAGRKAVLGDNPYNGGIESIYQALYWPGSGAAPEWTDSELANTDDDKLAKAVNKHDTPELMEIIDAWGNPLIYFHKDDYAKAFDSPHSYLTKNGLDVEARPYKRENGTFYNSESFQIYSMGEDEIPNTDDDILTWAN